MRTCDSSVVKTLMQNLYLGLEGGNPSPEVIDLRSK
ncbi:hypothetical protein PF005_g18037 [Phytophthora fragariae]|uniref:Uncharacterized protein n=1 Tax=Phytophthora fragariae TaxID=53985 RepID=A0A6A3HQK8_9STRA|nr:hypothetical protein PF003_g15630 [Phytophthora fragariae]KAE8931742.1 hypothetical protein PF009_g18207 [Phytophthora fragariae]KAE8971667.1 hypothetical protein PF011_g25951 [Phytophthora fragariae]KAE9069309.1 hypothetical protein PF010_g26714 [Phytophthora fragariae]KAE9096308.1 hypothetical protein PF007_g17049 [Phytophthora fragariae]